MFNTYIYGTPLGFDFFEDVASLKEYFKGLYISSRKGRRLMVNRREDGDTFYNYLRYGLAEKEGRPNSFFGMSVSIDHNEYASDFKEVFDWFDYLFDKLVGRGALFFVNAGEVVQYKVGKFKDDIEEVQWLKNNIPNLFTKAQAEKLYEYDASFSTVPSGQIRCFNDETPEAKVLEAFKKSRWIALSPNFKPEEEPIEIEPTDIDAQLNKYTQQLVPIAISPTKGQLPVLHSIIKESGEVVKLIEKYLASIQEYDERKACNLLIDKAKEISSNATTISDKIEVSNATGKSISGTRVATRKCSKCGRQLSIVQFKSADAKYCLECETVSANKQTRKCSKCGIVKAISEFSGQGQICKECSNPKSFFDFVDAKVVGIAIAIAAIIVVGAYFLLRGGNSDVVQSYGDSLVQSGTQGVDLESNKDRVDAASFYFLVESQDYLGAFDAIDGKPDSGKYLEQLRTAVENYLWDLMDNAKAAEELPKFFLGNKRLVEALSLNQSQWNLYASACNRLKSIINKQSLSPDDRAQAEKLIAGLPDSGLKEMFKHKIALKQASDGKSKTEAKGKVGQETPYLEYKYNGGEETIVADNDKVIKGRDFDDGTNIILRSNVNIKIKVGDKPVNSFGKTTTVVAQEGKSIIVYCGNKIQFSINGKKRRTFRKIETK